MKQLHGSEQGVKVCAPPSTLPLHLFSKLCRPLGSKMTNCFSKMTNCFTAALCRPRDFFRPQHCRGAPAHPPSQDGRPESIYCCEKLPNRASSIQNMEHALLPCHLSMESCLPFGRVLQVDFPEAHETTILIAPQYTSPVHSLPWHCLLAALNFKATAAARIILVFVLAPAHAGKRACRRQREGRAGLSARQTEPEGNEQIRSLCNIYKTKIDGRKGPQAMNKSRCNRINTPHSKATQRKAKPNQTPQTHTRGARQAEKNV
jgi:hypothetical protein